MPTGDELRRDQAAGLVSRAEAAQALTQWSAGESLVRLPVSAALPEVRSVRRIRTNPDDDNADADTRAKYLVDGRPYQIGTYTLWLSNHAGVELGLEPAEDGSRPGETYPEDDENSYLKYAAYGMMTFESSDRFSRSTGQTGVGWREIRDRVNSFHLGYDAFEDKSGKRTTDISEAVSKAKFTGLAMALELDGIARGFVNSTTAIDMRAAKRLRGDVELTATISGTASDSNVEGRIRNLEVWDSRGYWKGYATIAGYIEFGSASIGADGGYGGSITGITGAVGTFGGGQYRGSFYGPVSGLETAGVWYLSGSEFGVQKGIMGSFGAKHAPPSEQARLFRDFARRGWPCVQAALEIGSFRKYRTAFAQTAPQLSQ